MGGGDNTTHHAHTLGIAVADRRQGMGAQTRRAKGMRERQMRLRIQRQDDLSVTGETA